MRNSPTCSTCGARGMARPRSQGEPIADAPKALVCRFNPPTLNGWPRVEPDDSCEKYDKPLRVEDIGR